MAGFINTSYERQYVVVSRSPGQVILRPKCATEEEANALLSTYWQEFFSARIVPKERSLQLRISSVPKPVRRLDAYTPYDLEYPQVVVTDGENEVDVSKYVTANKPDAQVPGFYKVEYMLPLPGLERNVIWQAYISIEEPPVLRHIITPWNRDSYTIATLGRLVIEPQFQEALYEEGAPLYNFVTSNMSPALRPGTAQLCRGCIGYKSSKDLFVSGHKLPLATSIELDAGPGDSFTVHLDRIVTVAAWGMSGYAKGSIVQQNKKVYCATTDTVATDIPGASSKWVEGHLYSLEESVSIPDAEGIEATGYYKWAHASDGEMELLAVWAPVDLRGYVFSVDVKHAPQLGTYWGYYDKKYFKDYRPGDLVSYVSDGVLYLYRRNDTDIRDLSTEEAYRPGNYKNPHWDEVYAAWSDSRLRDFGKWIRPVSNAGNALVAKTCSLSEEACAAYAYLLSIPDAVVDAIGSKCSVLLYVLLQRTRNTYEGFRNAFRAIGLDVSDLHRVYPTVSAAGESGEDFAAVYAAEDTLKKLSMALRYDMLWQKGTDPTPADLQYAARCSSDAYPGGESELYFVRYAPGDPDNIGRSQYAIQEYRDGAWVTVYKVTGFGDDQSAADADGRIKGNNRYYRASLSLLDRLGTQALIDMGDKKQWIDLNAFSEPSQWVVSLLQYEVPIYIYLALTASVASVDEAWSAGRGMRHLHLAAYGGTPTLVVHPTRYFDLATFSTKETLASVQVLIDGEWEDAVPAEMRKGSAVYDFDKAVTVRFRLDLDVTIEKYWTSRHTMGLLGDNSGEVPIDASSELFSGDTLQLANGIVGVTPLFPDMSLAVAEFSYLKYNYILDGDHWVLDGSTPFGGYRTLDGAKAFATWFGPVVMLASAVSRVTDRDGKAIRYNIQGIGTQALLEVFGEYPEEIYIYGEQGNLIALISSPGGLTHCVQPDDAYSGDGERATMRFLLARR